MTTFELDMAVNETLDNTYFSERDILMKQIIEGLSYNTETADLICHFNNVGDEATSYTDFRHCDCDIYKTKNGRFFAHGGGGPMSMFSVSAGQNSSSGSSNRIVVLDEEEARSMCESRSSDADAETIEKFFTVKDA